MADCVVEVLKSGIFWAAVQSLAALFGIFYLVKYTQYTKRMMELQLETRRAEVAPVLTLSSVRGSATDAVSSEMTTNLNSSSVRNIHITVRNIGKGPALRFRGWHSAVDSSFKLQESQMLMRGPEAEDGVSTSFEVLASESAEMVFQRTAISKYWLCVLECEDTAGDKHQFQLIHIPRPAAIDPWLMVHGWLRS